MVGVGAKVHENSAAATPISALASRAYVEAAQVALIAFSPGNEILWHNERFAALWSVPRSVLERGTLAKLAQWLRSRGDAGALRLAMLLGDRTARAGQIAASDERVLAWRRMSFPGGQGQVWSFEDVTPARQAAQSLAEAHGWLRMLETHTPGVLLELNQSRRIMSVWGRSSAFFERGGGDLRGKRLTDIVPGPQGQALDERVRRVLATAEPEEYEYALHAASSKRVLTATAVLMPSESSPPSVALLIRDVTERARTQARLLEAERLASVGRLAAGIAHEVNNPLGYILLNLQRLRSGLADVARDLPGEDGQSLVNAVEMSLEGALRVRAIVRDLNRFTRPDDDQRIPLDLHRALDFAIEMAGPATRLRATVIRDFGKAPYVRAKQSRLTQLFLNLIVNAAHSIPIGAPGKNAIRVVTGTEVRGYAFVEVHDTGRGIPESDLQHIFDPFYTTKPEGVGTGLGLTICHEIVTSLGGEITVESEEGRGSMFRLLIPPAAEPTTPPPPSSSR